MPIQNLNLVEFDSHKNIEREFIRLIADEKIPQSILFTGAKGVGKASLTMRITHALLSQKQVSGGLFDDNGTNDIIISSDDSLLSQLHNFAHPDLMYLHLDSYQMYLSDDGTKKSIIPVDAIRKIESFIRQSASISKYKVIVIDAMDDLNESGSNALLKMLEEPPKNCIFILISHNIGNILPTIISRCYKYNIPPLDASEVERILKRLGYDNEQASFAAGLSGGSVGIGQHLAENNANELYNELQSFIESPSIANITEMATKYDKNHQQWDIAIYLMLQIIYQLICDNMSNKEDITKLIEIYNYTQQISVNEDKLKMGKSISMMLLGNNYRKNF